MLLVGIFVFAQLIHNVKASDVACITTSDCIAYCDARCKPCLATCVNNRCICTVTIGKKTN
ncbi:hypothetical protein KGM_210254 [Danaus plexippus plexippus]|uniref:Uncharacterized protein n=1 Tax=Danaus plexippus plexippus TaxID=278856 RepID=A0A212F9J1_DANPL|nr:hypothetical protein KGM_210254 [Danaus plexippus plexippus]